MFGRATITLGIGPHSSLSYLTVRKHNFIARLNVSYGLVPGGWSVCQI